LGRRDNVHIAIIAGGVFPPAMIAMTLRGVLASAPALR
jgi:hypothetical protein